MADVDIEVDQNLEKENFFDTSFGKIVNNAVDIGIRAVMPDLIEDQVISVKDAIIEGGFEKGIEEIKNSGIDLYESVKGIITGDFSNLSQIQLAVKDGGILDLVSTCVDKGLNYLEEKNILSDSIVELIKAGKNMLINQVSSNVENNYTLIVNNISKVQEYMENWNVAFENNDIEALVDSNSNIQDIMNDSSMGEIKEQMANLDTINTITSIVENSGSFSLSEDELILAQKI